MIFAKLNVDENPEIARRYNVMGMPLFMIFNDGHPGERSVGAVERRPLEEALRKHLRYNRDCHVKHLREW